MCSNATFREEYPMLVALHSSGQWIVLLPVFVKAQLGHDKELFPQSPLMIRSGSLIKAKRSLLGSRYTLIYTEPKTERFGMRKVSFTLKDCTDKSILSLRADQSDLMEEFKAFIGLS